MLRIPGHQPYASCNLLTSVTLGDNVTVGKYAFYNNSTTAELKHVYRNTKDPYTGTVYNQKYAVYYVKFNGPITSLVIGDNAVIGEGAFYGAASLTEVVLGEGAVIGDFAFYNCSSLENVVNLNSVISIGASAFSGDIHFIYTNDSYTFPDIDENGQYTFSYHAPALKEIDISSVTSLGANAFALCKEK